MKLITAAFLAIVVVFTRVSSVPVIDDRVLDGATIEVSIPYIVSISENTLHFCGGFIYSPGWVVTTASCVFTRQTNPLKVTANEVSLIATEEGEESIAVFQVFVHENYDETTKVNDIALLKLASNFTIPPATCIRYDEVLSSFGSNGWIGGWGSNLEFDGTPSSRPHNATLEVTNNKTCTGFDSFVWASMICAKPVADMGTPCTYDEGSPLVMHIGGDAAKEAVAVGIFSQNLQCQPDQPSVFTRLSAFYSWLINIAGRQPTTCTAI